MFGPSPDTLYELPRARGCCHRLPWAWAFQRAARGDQCNGRYRETRFPARTEPINGVVVLFLEHKPLGFGQKNMVKKGDLFHAPARLFGDDYAKLAYEGDWKTAKEHFRVARKHEDKPGVWWCAYESADETDVEISAKSIRSYQNAPLVEDEESDSSITAGLSDSDDEEDDDAWLDDPPASAKKRGKEPKKKAAKAPAKRFVSHPTHTRFSHTITLINTNTNTH